MAAASATPTTPTFSRRVSVDYFNASPSGPRTASLHSRRSSAAYSPVLSRLGSSHGRSGSAAGSDAHADGFGGCLADELGGWGEENEDGSEEEGDDEDCGEQHGEAEPFRERDSGIDVASSPAAAKQNGAVPLLAVPAPPRHTHRRSPSDYDGSEYGSESDLEESSLVSASLEARLAAVESLARRGAGDVAGQESVIGRTKEQLRDLGGQAGLESGATRLATAYSAISTHLSHQTRILQQLTSTLLSPLSPPLHPDVIEALLPPIIATLDLLPLLSPSAATTDGVHALADKTAELAGALAGLTDSLHMMRQTQQMASRRLRAVREVLAEWRRESAARDEGVRWIESGGWDRRLKERRCAAVCRDVLGGFEETCGRWRERLLAGAATGAPAVPA